MHAEAGSRSELALAATRGSSRKLLRGGAGKGGGSEGGAAGGAGGLGTTVAVTCGCHTKLASDRPPFTYTSARLRVRDAPGSTTVT